MKRIATLLRFIASTFTRAADRIAPEPPLQFGAAQDKSLADALADEAREQLFSPEFTAALEAAMDRIYTEPVRPTTFTRKLRAINGGRA